MPAGVRTRSFISEDNYLRQLVPKTYIEDLHSTTLCYFLDYRPGPDAERSLCKSFIDSLAKVLPTVRRSSVSLQTVTVAKEARSDGWVDILLRDKKAKQAIIIENKIRARDQLRQLPKYYRDLSSKGFKVLAAVYLTLDGREPSKNGWSAEDKTVPIIPVAYYRKDGFSLINDWLDPELEDKRCRTIHSLIRWYIEIIEQQREEVRVRALIGDFAKDLSRSPEALKTISDVFENRDAIEDALCEVLFDKLIAKVKHATTYPVTGDYSSETGGEITVECSNRFQYFVTIERDKTLTHGFRPVGTAFNASERPIFDHLFGEKAGYYARCYFKTCLNINLAEPALGKIFADAWIDEFVDRIRKNIEQFQNHINGTE